MAASSSLVEKEICDKKTTTLHCIGSWGSRRTDYVTEGTSFGKMEIDLVLDSNDFKQGQLSKSWNGSMIIKLTYLGTYAKGQEKTIEFSSCKLVHGKFDVSTPNRKGQAFRFFGNIREKDLGLVISGAYVTLRPNDVGMFCVWLPTSSIHKPAAAETSPTTNSSSSSCLVM
jgi:hypothetical protein